jgi:hypothetical protein
MYEDDLLPGREHQVRFPWQVSGVQAISVSEAMEKAPDGQFGRGVLAFDAGHKPTSLFCR